jgi:hypothetical protein
MPVKSLGWESGLELSVILNHRGIDEGKLIGCF